MRFTSSAQSDVGKSRGVNEDFYLIDRALGLYLVADGMGGHGNGEVASRIVAHAIARHVERHPVPALAWPGSGDRGERAANRLRTAIKEANRAVLEAVERDPDLVGMGSTLVALLINGGSAVVAHVGDSRAYRLSDRGLERLTQDHTWVHEQVSAGMLSENEAMNHPFRSVVTRAVGGGEEVAVDARELSVEAGDLFLLCSDGLNAVVSDSEIANRLRDGSSLEGRCRSLVAAANAGGGPDNITVLLIGAGVAG